ncbi:hypothetical protein Daus18300_004821 [Diaporthe australafricana]|uniref:NACHT domain-containing protein n=1 Tax=Diaporthe australafricana TaxID=127596 RepID=A0ABR3X5S3_9PEZI
MEALAAVSLASNVAQFLEYAIKAARLAFQIAGDAKPGQKSDIDETIQEVRQSLHLLEEIKDQTPGIVHDGALQSLVANCLDVATEVKGVLDNLGEKGKGTWKLVEGLQKTGYLIYKGKDLQRLSERLFKMRSEVSAHLIVLIKKQQRDIKQTLISFSYSNNAYQEQFGKHLDSSLNYLKSISKRFDSLTVSSVRGTGGAIHIASAEEDIQLEFQEAQEKSAYRFYRWNHATLCRELETLTDEKHRLILQTLSYSQLHERELAIPEAHQRTFEWMLSRCGGDHSFVEWLRSANGIFWIAEKAGSGKSTLMKFLAEHTTTHELLAEWVEAYGHQPKDSVVIAKHYFWSTGTTMQRSQEGLMRSILLQVLIQRPCLIQRICKERWEAPYADSFHPWTRPQLKSAMASLGHTDVKMCLFIDGLDEFGGDHRELVDILSQLSQLPNIKVCASSRPWIDFVDVFDSSPWKIYLHELTRQDILDYVTYELEREDKFRKLQSSSQAATSEIIRSIAKRAEGVFLWVYLVIRSLSRGLRNGDSLHILRTRLDALPGDLEEYFERILLSIEDVYRPRTARLFLTLCYARTSFPVLTFFFLNLDDNLDSSQAEPESQQEPLQFLSDWPDVDSSQFESLIAKKRELVAQCKDMIHISQDPNAHVLFAERVGFLHRTIVDFIQTDNVFKSLETFSGPSFDPRRLLFHANLGQVRSLIHLHRLTYIRTHLSQWILGCLFYAFEIEVTAPNQYKSILIGLDELEAMIMREFARWGLNNAMQTLLGNKEVASFLELTAMCDLKAYVLWRHPGYNLATILDEHAPKWRSPCRVQRGDVKEFEICRQKDDELSSWRLGSYLNVETSLQVPGLKSGSLRRSKYQQLNGGLQSTLVVVPQKPRGRLWKKMVAAFR